jgi:hypothetical protein
MKTAVAATTLSPTPLGTWLAALDARPSGELLLGGSGHLLLSEAEEENVVLQLRQGVLPRLFPADFAGSVCLLTGLAPGSDLLFTRVLSAWLLDAGIPYRIAGLLPLPVPALVADWLTSLRESGEEVSAAEKRLRLAQVEHSLASCETVVDLLPPDALPARLRDPDFRQDQYRRLAACLAQRSDILVAILRGQHLGRPGGTAEVVDWRRNPGHVPESFSTLPPAAGIPGRRLVVVDPTVDYTAESGI